MGLRPALLPRLAGTLVDTFALTSGNVRSVGLCDGYIYWLGLFRGCLADSCVFHLLLLIFLLLGVIACHHRDLFSPIYGARSIYKGICICVQES